MAFISNTTPTPNWLYNGEMKKMTGTELKVVLLITRKTLGWFDPMTLKRKEQDYIGQKQFIEFTGQSNRAIATAIQVCVKVGWIIARDRNGNLCNTPEKRRRRKIWYQLGSVFTSKISSEHSSQDENLVNKTTQSSEQNDTHLVNKVHNTKETLTKETIQTSVSKADYEFSFSSYLDKMKINKNRNIQIIWLFFLVKKRNYTNLKQASEAINRNLKAAKTLSGYSGKQIKKTMEWLDIKFNDGEKRWTLETVGKYIDDMEKQTKSQRIYI